MWEHAESVHELISTVRYVYIVLYLVAGSISYSIQYMS